jgi:hypothetical protein
MNAPGFAARAENWSAHLLDLSGSPPPNPLTGTSHPQ